MAQFLVSKSNLVKVVPDHVPSILASLTEPMSVVVHAAEVIGNVIKGEVVWIQGAGIIGLLIGLVCRNAGAKVYMAGLPQDKESRLVHVPLFGINPYVVGETVDVQEKVDVLFECSGSSNGIKGGLERLKKGGRAVLVALYEQEINFPINIAIRNEWNLLTSYSCLSNDYSRSLELIDQYQTQLKKILSIYSLTDVSKAFDDALKQKVLKPVLYMG